uniref:Adiponectin receptor protein n=1 Tax=Panagrolaimus superbus TaxID=310955 RepID=A0A914Y390_9BILA
MENSRNEGERLTISSSNDTVPREEPNHEESVTNKSNATTNVEPNISAQIPSSSIEITENEVETVVEEESTFIEPAKIKRWVVQHYEKLPTWLRDNEFIITGHRPPLPSIRSCLKSIFSIHSETGNIWTHLLGCIAFFILAVWFLIEAKEGTNLQEKIIFSFFFAGAILCLGLSFAFHTFICHSPTASKIFSKLDYAGITTLIIGSFIPYIYYCFYCRLEPKIIYISMICIFGLAAIIVSMLDKFSEIAFRPVRAGVFLAMGLSGVLPAFHLMYTDGWDVLINEMSFIPLVIMALLYIFGALLYGFRIPEKYFPGRFDLWFQSHQLFHICVVCAAFTHYYGIHRLAHLRLLEGKC